MRKINTEEFRRATRSTPREINREIDGEVFRGHGDTAGESGHLPLSLDGPRCLCGLHGSLEAYTSNVATMARYFGLDASAPEGRERVRQRTLTPAAAATPIIPAPKVA